MQDTSEIRGKIMSIIQRNGPSLPSNIANELGLSILFASAFLSELLSQKKLKISNLRVGNSPVYFISGQEPKLENFSEHLKSKEREAFLLLREKNFLIDEEQQPAIRVALRAIRDFAIVFEKGGKLFWRYFIVPESDFVNEKVEERTIVVSELKDVEKIKEGENKDVVEKVGEADEVGKEIEENEEDILEEIEPVKKRVVKKKSSKKNNDKFFNQVKEFLLSKSIEILDIEGVSQGDLILRVNENGREKLIVAYNKKRISEIEIIKAHKRAVELGLGYTILSLGEPIKKLSNLIEAIRNLSDIEKLE